MEKEKVNLWTKFKNRKKRYWIRKTILEVKRVRWPKGKKNWITFLQVIIFTLVIALFVYLVTISATGVWHGIGIKM